MVLEDDDGGGQEAVGAGDGGGTRRRSRNQVLGGRAKEEGNIWGGPFVPSEATTRDKRPFCPEWWLHPGQKVFLAGRENSQPAAHL